MQSQHLIGKKKLVTLSTEYILNLCKAAKLCFVSDYGRSWICYVGLLSKHNYVNCNLVKHDVPWVETKMKIVEIVAAAQ